jgi:DNA-binding NarL/FixJ family response regulator
MKNVRTYGAGQLQGAETNGADDGQGDSQKVHQLAKEICNLVFLDIDVPGVNPGEIANILKAAYPDTKVVLYTMRNGEVSSEPIMGHDGKPHPAIVNEFVTTVYEASLASNIQAIQKALTAFDPNNDVKPDPYGLSSRELQVLKCLVDGDTYKKIAEHCHISVGTVRSHIMNIYRKLNVNSRSSAIVKALQERLTRN